MNIQLIPQTENDREFIKDLFFQDKATEFQALGFDKNLLNNILEMQFCAQEKSYKSLFPDADRFIIFYKNNKIGRLTIDYSQNYHLIDIIINKKNQKKGLGTQILKNLISKATKENKIVLLSVAKNNPAQNLYKSLGFRIIGKDEMYLKMSTN